MIPRPAADPLDTIEEALHLPDDHHSRCESRNGKPCDCYMRSYTPTIEALALVRERLRRAEAVVEAAERYERRRQSSISPPEGSWQPVANALAVYRSYPEWATWVGLTEETP